MKAKGFLGAILLCGIVAAWGVGTQAQDPKAAAQNPFADKILIVNVLSRESFSEWLKDAEIRELGGRSFLVGTSLAKKEEFWSGDARLWIGINSIIRITECRDMEDFQRRVKMTRPVETPASAPVKP